MLLPHYYISSATLLNSAFLKSREIEGLLLDIDGTLKDFGAATVSASVVAWMRELQGDGIRLCLLSNGRKERIGRLAGELDLPFVAEAMKPMPTGCRRGLEVLGLPAKKVAVVGDQIFADVMAGRLARLFTVLVRPTSRVEPWFTRLKRPFEAPIRVLIRRRLDAHFPALVSEKI
jgi:HAD superfamily phosphatase (TIGR01668 family)